MMKTVTFVSLFFVVFLSLLACVKVQGRHYGVNNGPVIGVLTQVTPSSLEQYGEEYMDANYVKYLEMAGAKVVAIKGNQPREYYDKLFSQLNGVLFPGGGIDLKNSSSQYVYKSQHFFNLAMKANSQGDYFPIWGTCLGFEMLAILAADEYVLSDSDSENMTISLKLAHDYRQSRMLSDAHWDIIRYLEDEPVAANYHHFSLTRKTYESSKALQGFFRVISYDFDRNGIEYISTIEGHKFPFYATQWHPEKNPFLWRPGKAVDHTAHAIEVSQYMANFFVNEARRNLHVFKNVADVLVENDRIVYFEKDIAQSYFYNVTN